MNRYDMDDDIYSDKDDDSVDDEMIDAIREMPYTNDYVHRPVVREEQRVQIQPRPYVQTRPRAQRPKPLETNTALIPGGSKPQISVLAMGSLVFATIVCSIVPR